MESLVHSSSASTTSLTSRCFILQNKHRAFAKDAIFFSGLSSTRPFSAWSVSIGPTVRKLVISASAGERKDRNSNKKVDKHSFAPKPDECFFPEAVLLKERNVQEDGKLLPEFADADEEELFEFLNLQLESKLNVERTRHYEVVYLIHEDRVDEVESVVSKVKEYIEEKKGRIWRLNNWGLRRLAYKIKKATHANYILMNFELGAKWINDFKNMLDRDGRIIRHLVMKRDEAITEDCPPPPEFHTLRANMVDDDVDEFDVDDDDDDGEDWDDDSESDMVADGGFDDAEVATIIHANGNDDVSEMDGLGDLRKGRRTLKAEKMEKDTAQAIYDLDLISALMADRSYSFHATAW